MKKDSFNHKFLSFIIIGIIILLSACTLVGPQKKSPSGSTNVSRKIGFEERKAEDLLKNSISIPYPDRKIFTPTALSNDGIAYGEAVDQGHLSNLLSRPRYTCTGSNLWRLDETDTRGIIRSHGYMQ